MEYELVLQHHGIKGMRWGIRRFQKKDGSLTPDGKKRYAKKDAKSPGAEVAEKVKNDPRYAAARTYAKEMVDKHSDAELDEIVKGHWSKREEYTLKAENEGLVDESKWSKHMDTAMDHERKANAIENERNNRKKEREAYEKQKDEAVKSGNAEEVLKFKNDLTPQQRAEAYNRLQWEQNMKNLAPKQVDEGRARADKFFKDVDTISGYADTAAKAWNTFTNFYNAFSDSDVSLPKIDRDLTKGNRQTRKEEKKKKAAKSAAAGGGNS